MARSICLVLTLTTGTGDSRTELPRMMPDTTASSNVRLKTVSGLAKGRVSCPSRAMMTAGKAVAMAKMRAHFFIRRSSLYGRKYIVRLV